MGARTINGNKFDMLVPTFTLPSGGIEEWSLNGARNHPFHLHVYHVQIVEEGGCGEFEEGEYYDTVAENCTLRFSLALDNAYDGRTIMHCHILEHEDQGAMGWADVLDGLPAPTFPADGDLSAPYSDKYQLGGGEPEPPTDPTAVQVESISLSTVNMGQGAKVVRASVVVQDDAGNLITGATVSGAFHGTFEETVVASEPTDANGLTTIDTSQSAKGKLEATFCVTGIDSNQQTLADFSAGDGDVCGSL